MFLGRLTKAGGAIRAKFKKNLGQRLFMVTKPKELEMSLQILENIKVKKKAFDANLNILNNSFLFF